MESQRWGDIKLLTKKKKKLRPPLIPGALSTYTLFLLKKRNITLSMTREGLRQLKKKCRSYGIFRKSSEFQVPFP